MNLILSEIIVDFGRHQHSLAGWERRAGRADFLFLGVGWPVRSGAMASSRRLHVPFWLLRAPPGASSVAQCAGPSRGGRARAPRSARCSGRGAPARGSVCLRTRPRLLRALAGRRSLASRRPSSTLELPQPRLAFWAASRSRCVRSGAGSAARRASGWRRRAPVGAFLRLRVRTVQPTFVRRYAPFWARGLGAGACAVWFR